MWEKINNFLKGQIVTSLIYIVLGICLVFMPVNMINVICKFVFGILLILVGLYHILIYVAEKLNSTIFDLFSGGILMVLGIFLFMNPQIVVKLLPILLGTFILVDSIWTLKGSFKLKKRGVDTWRFLLFGSLIFIALGISLVVNPFTMVKYTVIFAGWIFLCNGIIDLIYLVLLKKGLKELKQDVEAVDADGKILSDGTDSDVDGMNAEDFVQEEKDIQPEPEYAPWNSRKKKDAPEEMHDFADTAENAAAEEKHVEEVDISRMEESLDDVQISEEEVSSGETEHSFSETEGVIPPAGRGAYTVSQPTITDEDLSDMKDESLLDVISRKRKDSRKENE